MTAAIQEHLDEHLDGEQPAPVAAPSLVQMDTVVPWPSGVPNAAVVEKILDGSADVADSLRDTTIRVLSITPSSVEPGSEVCRPAAMTLWRALVAVEASPEKDAPVHKDALEQLIHELDSSLQQIGQLAPEGTPQHADDLKAGLARCAVQLAEIAHTRSNLVTDAPAPARPSGARLVSSGEVEKERTQGGTPKVLWVGLSLSAALALGVQVFLRVSAGSTEPLPVPRGAPAGTVGVEHAGTTILTARPGQTNPQDLENYKERAKAEGKMVFEPAPGQLILLPSPSGGEQPPFPPDTPKGGNQ